MRSPVRSGALALLAAALLAGCGAPPHGTAPVAAAIAARPGPALPGTTEPPPASLAPAPAAAAAVSLARVIPPAVAAAPPTAAEPGAQPAPPPASAPVAAASRLPGIGATDARIRVDSGAAPWRSIGMVVAEGGGRCTGALIGPRAVLTAAHCVIHARTTQPLPPQAVAYHIGPTPGRPGRRVPVASIVMAPGFSALPGPRPDPAAPANADWAVLHLEPDVPPAPDDFVLRVVEGLMPPWTELAFGGFQHDHGLALVADTSCWIVGYGQDRGGRVMLRHSCNATGGSSGGPLLVRRPDGLWMVAGVGSLALGSDAGGWAVPSDAIWRGLAEMAR